MAFFKKVKINGKWYPVAVAAGGIADTDEVARILAEISTVSPGDTYAVLANLGTVLAGLMAEGRSVKLKGVGTFYYTCGSEGKGVDTPEEVSASQITEVRVRFIPEYGRNQQGKVNKRTLISKFLHWVDLADLAAGGDGKGDK